jgi:hypothetical protein
MIRPLIAIGPRAVEYLDPFFAPFLLVFSLTCQLILHQTRMPSQPLNDFFKDLSKVFAVRRLKLPVKNRRTQYSIITHHNGDYSIAEDIRAPSEFPIPSPTLYLNSSPLVHPSSLARDPGLEVSFNISSATSSPGDSSARKASDMAQTFLPLVQGVAGAIPLAGPPMQAAISGLLSILQVIDVRAYCVTGMILDSKVIAET